QGRTRGQEQAYRPPPAATSPSASTHALSPIAPGGAVGDSKERYRPVCVAIDASCGKIGRNESVISTCPRHTASNRKRTPRAADGLSDDGLGLACGVARPARRRNGCRDGGVGEARFRSQPFYAVVEHGNNGRAVTL